LILVIVLTAQASLRRLGLRVSIVRRRAAPGPAEPLPEALEADSSGARCHEP
jgi:hypothetical protein